MSAANQWNAAPDGSGAWLTWANLQPTDVLCANGKTNIYVNVGFTCGSITTSGGGIGADGGLFYVQTGAKTFTLTTDIVAGTTGCLRIDHSSGTVAVIGDVTAGGSQNAYGIHKYSGAGTLTVEGAILGGSASYCYGLFHQSAGGATAVTGNVTGGSASYCHGLFHQSSGGATTITGNVTGGSATSAMGAQAFAGTITITGTVTAGSAWATYGAMGNGETTLVTVIGSIINSNTGGPGVAGIYHWQPASVAHYWQVAWNGSNNQRYTVPPAADDVRLGESIGYVNETLTAGTLALPAEGDVQTAVGYGAAGTEFTGALDLPAESDVRAGTGYGDSGTEFTGSMTPGGGPLVGAGGLVG